MEMSGWDERGFTLGRTQWDGGSDIWHPTASSRGGEGRRGDVAPHPSRLSLLTG